MSSTTAAPESMPAPTRSAASIAAVIAETIATEIEAKPAQVRAAVELLDEGATVPFIARYRKEVTGGLDDTQLRNLETRLVYLREMEDRRDAILASIAEQGKLTKALLGDLLAADSKSRLEDLYLPTSPSAAPRRRSRAKPGWSRWPTRSWPILRSTRPNVRKPSSTPTRAWPMPPPRSTARARS